MPLIAILHSLKKYLNHNDKILLKIICIMKIFVLPLQCKRRIKHTKVIINNRRDAGHPPAARQRDPKVVIVLRSGDGRGDRALAVVDRLRLGESMNVWLNNGTDASAWYLMRPCRSFGEGIPFSKNVREAETASRTFFYTGIISEIPPGIISHCPDELH